MKKPIDKSEKKVYNKTIETNTKTAEKVLKTEKRKNYDD